MIATNKFRYGIEAPVFLVLFAITLSAPASSNFIIYRTCYVTMGRNESDCSRLGVNTTDNATIELEAEVQAVANYITITVEMLALVVPCILCMFIGPYSDKRGRKPILIVSLTGYFCSFIIKAIIAAIPDMSPWCLFLEGVPIMLTGGMTSFIMIAFCYLIDVSPPENRGLRMGIMEASLGLGVLIGLLLSSHAFFWLGYTGLFVLCLCIIGVALLLTIFLLRESIKQSDLQPNVKFFTFEHIKEMCRTTFKPREGYNRLVLLTCIGSVILYVMAEASGGAEGLLLRAKFHWNLEKLTNYGSMRIAISIVGTCVCIYVFHTLLKISECVLVIVGLCFCVASTSIIVVAQYDWQIYTAAGIRVMAGLINPMIRSIASKLIPHDDVGKVFSFVVSVETLIAILIGPLYTVIYTNIMHVFPGGFDVIPVCLYFVIIVNFVYMYNLHKRPNAIIFVSDGKNHLKP